LYGKSEEYLLVRSKNKIDRHYNNTIRREDIIFAEEAYFKFMEMEPSLYPVTRG
jgi:hypothetical protein